MSLTLDRQPLYKTRNSQLAPQCQPHPPHPLVILSLLLLLLFCSRVSGLGSLSWTPPSCELRVASFITHYQAGLEDSPKLLFIRYSY